MNKEEGYMEVRHMRELNNYVKEEIREIVYNFFVEECETERSEISDETNVIEDLDGDSLMFVELIDIIQRKYQLNIQLQSVGKYLLKKQADTIGEVIKTAELVFQYENDIVNMER